MHDARPRRREEYGNHRQEAKGEGKVDGRSKSAPLLCSLAQRPVRLLRAGPRGWQRTGHWFSAVGSGGLTTRHLPSPLPRWLAAHSGVRGGCARAGVQRRGGRTLDVPLLSASTRVHVLQEDVAFRKKQAEEKKAMQAAAANMKKKK